MSAILDEKPNVLLDKFLQSYSEVHEFDKQKALRLIQEAIHHYRTQWSENSNQGQLEKRWYESLNNDDCDDQSYLTEPAYDVYDDDYYFTDLWACWHMYSRPYLRSLSKINPQVPTQSILDMLENVKSVVDLGCGIGYTTAALKQLFPKARVYGTNLQDTKLYEFCEKMSQDFDFELVTSPEKISGGADFVFASEYFEHIRFVIEHLSEILEFLKPKFLYIANAFNTISVGHFEWYRQSNNPLLVTHQSKISGEFNGLLRERGYKMIRTKNWNHRPLLWGKI